MRLVQNADGIVVLRWTWMPFWLAVNPKMQTALEKATNDYIALHSLTASDEHLWMLHNFVRDHIQELFPGLPGLGSYLDALAFVEEPGESP